MKNKSAAFAVLFILPTIILALSLCACNEVLYDPPTENVSTAKPTEAHFHTFSDWETVVSATCSTPGIKKRACLGCERTEESLSPMIDHKFTETVVAPDCKSEGYTLLTCDCGYQEKSVTAEKLTHTLKSTVVPPTCEDSGYTSYLCTACGHSYNSDTVEPTGHDYTVKKIYPTLISEGSKTYTCHCEFSYTEKIPYSNIFKNAYAESTEVLARGIDVSRWNHKLDAKDNYLPLDWNAIKSSGVDFVILKAGSTKTGIEPTFEMDYEGARAAGLEIGVYFYTYSTTLAGVKSDVQNLMSWLEGKMFEYPIYLDLEDPSLEVLPLNTIEDMCIEFISTLQANGYYAGLYTNHNWLSYILNKENMISSYEIWYARYPNTDTPVWNEEKYGNHLGMWQYSESGTISGFDCAFDLNFAYKNYKEIMEKWELNGFTQTDAV